MKFQELTHKIIGCSMEVHKNLGNGFPEVMYQRALAVELDLQKIIYEREFEMPVYYKGTYIGTRRADFLVEKFISVELKAQLQLEDAHLAPFSRSSGLMTMGLAVPSSAMTLGARLPSAKVFIFC